MPLVLTLSWLELPRYASTVLPTERTPGDLLSYLDLRVATGALPGELRLHVDLLDWADVDVIHPGKGWVFLPISEPGGGAITRRLAHTCKSVTRCGWSHWPDIASSASGGVGLSGVHRTGLYQ